MTQQDLLAVQVTDSHVTSPDEQGRLQTQSARILQRLREGPASNQELSAIALRFGARLHDLRKAGYAVSVIERDHASGKVVYALEPAE